ncbi:MAG: hypothetical protein WC881_07520, partial [Elusimicrobiota bacterium]
MSKTLLLCLAALLSAGCAAKWVIPLRHPPDFGLQTEPSPLPELRIRVDRLADDRDDAGALGRNQVGDYRGSGGSHRIVMHQDAPFFVSRSIENGLHVAGLKPTEPAGPCDASLSGTLTHYWVDARQLAPGGTEAAAWVESDIILRRCPAGESLLRKRYSGRADKLWDGPAASPGEAKKRLGWLL